jgi:hypothetical protein
MISPHLIILENHSIKNTIFKIQVKTTIKIKQVRIIFSTQIMTKLYKVGKLDSILKVMSYIKNKKEI